MPTMTLLEITQNILSAMSSDEVNSISDTVEALQVAEEIRNTYYDQFSTRDLSRNKGLINLQGLGTAFPHMMTIPANAVALEWIKYRNHRDDALTFNKVEYVEPEEFIRMFVESPSPSSGNFVEVALLPSSPLTYPLRNDKSPEFYTIFDQNQSIVFDSFDADYEDSLQGSNAIAWGSIQQEFLLEDDFVPPIPVHMFPLLLAEAKSACFHNYKETANAKEEQRARRQLVRSQSITDATLDQRAGPFDYVNYGRKR